MEKLKSSVTLNPQNEMIEELNRVAQIMSDTSQYTSKTAYLVSAQAGAGRGGAGRG